MKLVKQLVAGMLIVGLISAPSVIRADQAPMDEVQTACAQAQFDAQRDISPWLWFGLGFFTNWIGVVVAYVLTPSVPASRLIGKSPEYVRSYKQCYIEQAKTIQTQSVLKGFVASSLIYIVGCGCLWGGLFNIR